MFVVRVRKYSCGTKVVGSFTRGQILVIVTFTLRTCGTLIAEKSISCGRKKEMS